MYNSMNLGKTQTVPANLKSSITQDERDAIARLAIERTRDAYLYNTDVSAILGVRVVMVASSSFAARGYAATRQKIGEIATVNGGSIDVFYSQTFAEMRNG